MDVRFYLIVCVVGACVSVVENSVCTHADRTDNLTLRGGINAGKFTKREKAKTIKSCIDECCKDTSCDVAFRLGSVCYSINCYSVQSCEAIPTVSSNPTGNVQISHVFHDADKNEHTDKPPTRNSVRKNTLPTNNNVCLFSRVAYNQTIVGGIRSWQSTDLGKFVDVHDCADKCCRHDNCKVALVRDNQCYAIECFEKTYCESREAPSTERNTNILVYMNIINGERQTLKDTCNKKCTNGVCTNENTCLCDVGVKGEYCDEGETDGKCDPDCGLHGKCDSFDSCTCDQGWEGYKCDEKILCNPPCINGICTSSYKRRCKCKFGWTGQYCNQTNGDKAVLASTGEQVLFTHTEIEPELAIKVPAESPPLRGSEPVSAITVAACCGVASMCLLIIAVLSKTKQNRALRREYLESKNVLN